MPESFRPEAAGVNENHKMQAQPDLPLADLARNCDCVGGLFRLRDVSAFVIAVVTLMILNDPQPPPALVVVCTSGTV